MVNKILCPTQISTADIVVLAIKPQIMGLIYLTSQVPEFYTIQKILQKQMQFRR